MSSLIRYPRREIRQLPLWTILNMAEISEISVTFEHYSCGLDEEICHWYLVIRNQDTWVRWKGGRSFDVLSTWDPVMRRSYLSGRTPLKDETSLRDGGKPPNVHIGLFLFVLFQGIWRTTRKFQYKVVEWWPGRCSACHYRVAFPEWLLWCNHWTNITTIRSQWWAIQYLRSASREMSHFHRQPSRPWVKITSWIIQTLSKNGLWKKTRLWSNG